MGKISKNVSLFYYLTAEEVWFLLKSQHNLATKTNDKEQNLLLVL